ncbi:MAG TPA: type II CAAX endopeptidase family protein [Planctomycetota bacterium]|jgi:hypothetical protein
MTAPPSVFRAIAILCKAALRRRLNRFSHNMNRALRKKKADAPEKRTATARRSRGSVLGMLFLGGIFLLNGTMVCSLFLGRLSQAITDRDAARTYVLVDRHVYQQLETVANSLHIADQWPEGSSERSKGRQQWLEHLDKVFAQEGRIIQSPEPERPAQIAQLRSVFVEKGLGGFRARQRGAAALWECSATPGKPLAHALGMTYLLLGAALTLMMLGQHQQHIGTTDWSMEWLYTLPVPARVIFLSQIAELVAGNFFNLFITFPLSLMMCITVGMGWWSAPVALLVTLYTGALIGCLHTIAETWFKKTFAAGRLRNIQACIVVLGTLVFFVLMWLACSEAGPVYLVHACSYFPAIALWNPFSLPALFSEGSLAWGLIGAIMLMVATVAVLLSTRVCERLVAGGLIRAGGAYEGVRKEGSLATAPARSLPNWMRGISGKELRLLLRDRTFLVQALLMPVLILGFQIAINPQLLRGAAGNIQHGATLAYGLGAYVLAFSAFNVLAVEGQALWLLYTFPRDICTILLQKAILWSAFAVLYTLVTLAVCAAYNPALNWSALSFGVTALVGVVIYAFIAAGLGALATEPFELELQRRVDPMMMQLYLLLAAMYAHAIYSPLIWTKVVQVILSILLALALWQKVRERIPYLLDPTESPPPSIGLSDGLIAALAFFVLQGITALLIFAADPSMPDGAKVLIAFLSAGLLVTTLTLYIYWRAKVPRLWSTLGFCAAKDGPPASFLRSIATGVGCGLVASVFAVLYLWCLEHSDLLRALRDQTPRFLPRDDSSAWWLAGLAVFAAPLFEEYIFRGLVYRGMRSTMRPAVAILASAAIFAIVHPPISALPVFVLGAMAAVAFEKSRLIIAPILAHMVYNAVVVGLPLFAK